MFKYYVSYTYRFLGIWSCYGSAYFELSSPIETYEDIEDIHSRLSVKHWVPVNTVTVLGWKKLQ